jgi:hypothetical protein
VAVPRLVASVIACSVGLAFWWALTEPLPIPPLLLYAVPAVMLFTAGIIAGRLGAVAAPVALLFSVLLGSLIGTWIHRAYVPSAPAVSSFGGIAIDAAGTLVLPLVLAAALGAVGGLIGERAFPLPPHFR